ncbi:MAG: hypothetical protein PHC51_09775 [bacterium]|nr:hypothetical protein [bacterium]
MPGAKRKFHKAQALVALLSLLLLAVIYHRMNSIPPVNFSRLEHSQWTISDAGKAYIPSHLPAGEKSSGAEMPEGRATFTASLDYQGEAAVGFDISTSVPLAIHAIYIKADGAEIPGPRLSSSPSADYWSTVTVNVPQSLHSSLTGIQLRISSSIPSGWIAARNLTIFSTHDSSQVPNWELANTNLLLIALSLVIGLTVTAVCQITGRNSYIFFATSLVVLTLTTVYPELFYYWDEWSMLHRFTQNGIDAIWVPHNEHSLPLFFALYWIETKLAGSHYSYVLILSLICHVLNGILTLKLIRHFTSLSQNTERLLYAAFLFSALATEVLQWAFVQCISLSLTAVLLALISGVNYCRTGNTRQLLYTGLAVMAAPLFFGNGFIAMPLLIAILALSFFFHRSENVYVFQYGKISRLFIITAIATGLSVTFYLLTKPTNASFSHTAGSSNPLEHISEILNYIFVGSQAGTIARGLGLLPGLGNGAPGAITTTLAIPVEPLFFFAIMGLTVNLGLLLFYLRKLERNSLFFWLLAQIFILASFALPALGRYNLGALQAMSLRYHAFALPGLIFLLTPLAQFFDSKSCKPGGRAIIFAALVIFFSLQFFMKGRMSDFQEYGSANRSFLGRLVNWTHEMPDATNYTQGAYEGSDTDKAGLFPALPGTLTPGMHPLQVLEIYGGTGGITFCQP